ncbi:MAG: GreA/GreB family elongation factor, partial [Candidatus Eisenbacteria bacterium]|nr:GreA/GreB family elongation factor [Candidatus Eisenbacteria bacterium]
LSFRNTFRIIEGLGGEEEVPLPSLDRKRGIRTNLNLIRRFLEQHPSSKTSSSHIHGPILKQWIMDERTHSDERVALYLFLESELEIQEQGKGDVIRTALADGLEPSDVGEQSHQFAILDAGFSHGDSKTDAILFGLASRHSAVREKAAAALRENAEEGKNLLIDLLRNPGRRPVAALALIQHSVNAPDNDPFWPDPWEAAFGAALLADVTTRDMLRRQAVAILDPKGTLAQKAGRTEPSENIASRWSHFLKQWRSSERALFHVYAFLSKAGLGRVVDEVKGVRDAATNRALQGEGEKIEILGIPMTQGTYEMLIAERDRTALALRTTIPEAIKTAREMGDLRENAEYDAAKLKQSQETDRLGSLNRRIQQAEIIEDMTLPEDKAGPGTEIVLEDTQSGECHTHWILGEGDAHLGDDVISVMAPLGQAVLGKSAGVTIELDDQDGEGRQSYRLLEIRRRLP